MAVVPRIPSEKNDQKKSFFFTHQMVVGGWGGQIEKCWLDAKSNRVF